MVWCCLVPLLAILMPGMVQAQDQPAVVAEPDLQYRVSMPEPWTQYLHVEAKLEGQALVEAGDTLFVEMATWTPGSYKIRDYAGMVPRVFARTGEGRLLPITKVDKRRWAVDRQGTAMVQLSYRVWCNEHSVRTPYIDTEHASIVPAGVFIYPAAYDGPVSVTVEPYPDWNQLHSGLERHPQDPWTLLAPNRDVWLDAPFEVGTQTVLEFEAAGIPHTIAVTGEHSADPERMKADFAAIVETTTDIFGHNPVDHYTFLIQNTPDTYGGLEHLNSTSMVYERWRYNSESDWQRFLGLASHEYFHLWNVKRVRPQALGPFDYGCENYTRSHWITEGFTQYYDDLILRRAGLMSENRYLQIAGYNIDRAFNRPGDSIQPVSEASFDAWIKHYHYTPNSLNVTVDYYAKGAVLAMYLDAYILAKSKGKRRLDNVLRELYARYRKDPGRGYTEAEFAQILSKVAGEDMGWFLERHVYGTERVELEPVFAGIGAILTDRADPDGVLKLGLSTNSQNRVRYVLDGHPAYEAGIMPDDEIVAVDGWRFEGDWGGFLGRARAGETLEVTVNRRGQLRSIPVALFLVQRTDFAISPDPEAGKLEQALYRQWLSLDGE